MRVCLKLGDALAVGLPMVTFNTTRPHSQFSPKRRPSATAVERLDRHIDEGTSKEMSFVTCHTNSRIRQCIAQDAIASANEQYTETTHHRRQAVPMPSCLGLSATKR